MSKIRLFSPLLLATAMLAGCQSQQSTVPNVEVAKVDPKPEVAAPKPAGINGKWIPTNADAQKIYYNEFRNGKFVSRSPDGANTIAAGKYSTATDGTITMNWYSEARKQNSSAICKKLSDVEMQCTSGSSVFNLRRA